MRKVTTVSLNGNAYQLEEGAYEALRRYLESAERALAANPDRAEILQDLEQAIADKCNAYLGRTRNVVATAEAEEILRQMGPVEGADAAGGNTSTGGTEQSSPAGMYPLVRRRRLYRLPQEGMLGGVCAGVGAYLDIDVVWVRLGYALGAMFTGGVWFFVWLVQLCITPKAVTPEEIAAAHGGPLNAREVMERARRTGRAAAEGLSDAGRNLKEKFGGSAG